MSMPKLLNPSSMSESNSNFDRTQKAPKLPKITQEIEVQGNDYESDRFEEEEEDCS